MTRIAIVAAMAQELNGLKEHLINPICMPYAGRDFWLGQISGKEVVLVLAKIGKVAAATTTTLLIQHFKATQIIFTGVAGGIGAKVKVGDLIIATELLQHDMNASPLFPIYEIPLYGRSHFPTHTRLSFELQNACKQVVQKIQEIPIKNTNNSSDASILALQQGLLELGLPQPQVLSGLIVSGDQFIASQQASTDLQKNLPLALAVEMEGAAVAQVCHDFGIPLAVLRVISDKADDQAHLDFNLFIEKVACFYSQAVVFNLLSRL